MWSEQVAGKSVYAVWDYRPNIVMQWTMEAEVSVKCGYVESYENMYLSLLLIIISFV